MTKEKIIPLLNKTFSTFSDDELPKGNFTFFRGKVRDLFDLGKHFLIVTSDRVSAFDRVLATIPCKGEVLNKLALFWFKQTQDILPNHIEKEVTGRTALVKKGDVIPVEVVIRGYLTGSAWRDYQAGKSVSGIELPSGLRFNEAFPEPLLTPSTKAEQGAHDEPVSEDEIIKRNLVSRDLWSEVKRAAFSLFKRGTELAKSRGLILVDTKYEFGIINGKLHLIDEVHTPDSSRFWYADDYKSLFEAGEKQKKVDKEFLRQWLMEEKNFMGDGDIPEIPDEIRVEVALRYIQAYELLTGESFDPDSRDPEKEKTTVFDELSKA